MPKLPCHSASMAAACVAAVVPSQVTVTSCQLAAAAIWAGLPSRAPLTRGRPCLPVLGGAGAYSTALAGSRVVQVVPATFKGSPWKAASPAPWMPRPGKAPVSKASSCPASSTWLGVPLPRQSRNSTGNAAGEEQNGSCTTIAAITHVFPDAIFFPPCADPS